MHPILFRIPFLGWPIHLYGVMIVTGFMLALYVVFRQAKRIGKYEEDILDFGFWALLGGILGARILFIIVEWRQYFIDDPWVSIGSIKIPRVLALWQGGLVFWGAALGGFIAFLIFAQKRSLPKLLLADMLVLGLPLAQMFGRLGCLSAGCCFGKPFYHLGSDGSVIANLPLVMKFPLGSIAYYDIIQSADTQTAGLMYKMGTTLPLFPSQLAESFGAGIIFFILLLMIPRKWFHGQILICYGILYSIMRSFLEVFRGDIERGFIFDDLLSTSQFVSILVVVASLIAVVVLKKRKAVSCPKGILS